MVGPAEGFEVGGMGVLMSTVEREGSSVSLTCVRVLRTRWAHVGVVRMTGKTTYRGIFTWPDSFRIHTWRLSPLWAPGG